MQINTTDAIFKALTAANKLFIIVCSFRKVDKHVFRAYNTISVTAQRTIIRKGGSYVEKRAILLSSYITFNATNKRDSVTSNCIYKIEDVRFMLKRILKTRDLWGKLISGIKGDFLDILEKESLNELEASRRDYFLSIAAEDAAKAANILLPLKEVCAKILIELYKLIKFSDESVLVMQRGIIQHEINLKLIIVALIAFVEAIILTEATHVVIIELQDSIVYFNLDSKLELKVLGKQDVKTTS
ncbi:hypothetical protein HBI48_132720 [Parastagonospora nodorum]|nr:hypothetical protein HBI48_132720 [Parastagonospora nodorum]